MTNTRSSQSIWQFITNIQVAITTESLALQGGEEVRSLKDLDMTS
ncbi:MAG: hypothetical protein QXQ57_03665 [Sulfolobales archaeon]